MHLFKKLLSLEMYLILKSFQFPSLKSHTQSRGIIACMILQTQVLQSLHWEPLFSPCGCRSFSRGFVSWVVGDGLK